MLESPLWNLLFLAGTIAMMGYAYYSRHEHTQRISIVILGIYLVSQVAIRTQFMHTVYLGADVIGLTYCLVLLSEDALQMVTWWIAALFMAMLLLHLINYLSPIAWLKYQIAGNVLYAAQLVMLGIYGKHYGQQARIRASHHDDLFHRMTMCAKYRGKLDRVQ